MLGVKAQSSTELLFLDEHLNYKTKWVMGPLLPAGAYQGRMIEYEKSVIFVGGSDGVDGKHLYQLDSPQGQWKELDQVLKTRRSMHVAFLIPDEFVNCS